MEMLCLILCDLGFYDYCISTESNNILTLNILIRKIVVRYLTYCWFNLEYSFRQTGQKHGC